MSIFTEVLSVILFSMSFLQEKQSETPRYFQAANKNLTKFLIGFLCNVSLLLLHRHGTTFSYCPQTQRKSFSFIYKRAETTKTNKKWDTK